MSSPLLWFGNAAKFLKSQLVIPGSTSGNLTIQPAAVTTSHTLTMPGAQGGVSTVLTNNGSGTLSWGSSSSSPVIAQYYRSATASVTANTPINFDTQVIDTNSAVTTGASWKFTAPSTGYYYLSASLYSTSAQATCYISKNGTNAMYIFSLPTLGALYGAGQVISLSSGDYIDLRPDGTVSIHGQAAPSDANITIFKIG